MSYAEPSGKLQRPARQMQCRTMAGQPPDFQLFPRNPVLDARAKRLGAGLFRRKACGKALGKVFPALAIGDLLVSKNLLQKAVAIPGNGVGDTLNFHNVDASPYEHERIFPESTVAQLPPTGYRNVPKIGDVTVKIRLPRSDHVDVLHTEDLVEWDLRLTATCAEEPQRVMRFLTGAVLSCGGWVLSRSMPGSDTVEMSFEFARAVSLEVYSVLIAAGLELSRDAHVSMTELCQCTRNLMVTKAFDVARVRLLVLTAPLNGKGHKDNSQGAELA